MKVTAVILAIIALFFVSCSAKNKQYVQERADQRWGEVGFEVVGYEGHQWGFFGYFGYGGAKVWYMLKKSPDNGITYSGYLVRWGDEIHVYGPHAKDAIRP